MSLCGISGIIIVSSDGFLPNGHQAITCTNGDVSGGLPSDTGKKFEDVLILIIKQTEIILKCKEFQGLNELKTA